MSRVTIVIARIRGNITPCITTHKPTSSRGGLVISGISVQPHSRAPPGFRKPRHLADCVFRHVMRFTNAWALASERSSLRWDGPELAVCPVQLEHGATLSCRGLELSAASRHVQVRRGFLRSCMSAPLSLTRSSVPAATLQEREMYIRLPRPFTCSAHGEVITARLRYGFESKPAELGADCSSRTLVMLLGSSSPIIPEAYTRNSEIILQILGFTIQGEP